MKLQNKTNLSDTSTASKKYRSTKTQQLVHKITKSCGINCRNHDVEICNLKKYDIKKY